MRAPLVLLFAVGVSSMKLPEVDISHMNETQNYQPLLIPMIDNMMDILNDMKDMQNEGVQQPCQETTKSAMPEDDSAHMDGVGPRIFCHVRLTQKWQDCRDTCANLTFTQVMSCKTNNWYTYLKACFGGTDIMECSELPTSTTSGSGDGSDDGSGDESGAGSGSGDGSADGSGSVDGTGSGDGT